MKKKNLKMFAVSLFLCFMVSFFFTGCSGNSIDYTKISDSENLTLELSSHGNSAALDEITRMARTDSESGENAQNVISDGLYYISQNINNQDMDQATIEKMLYYGYYISHFIEKTESAENVSQLENDAKNAYDASYNTYAGLKYVYRGESDDQYDFHINNAKDALSKIGK